MSRTISAGRLCFLRFRRHPEAADAAAADLAPAPAPPALAASSGLRPASAPSSRPKAELVDVAAERTDDAAAAQQAAFLQWCLRLMS